MLLGSFQGSGSEVEIPAAKKENYANVRCDPYTSLRETYGGDIMV